MYDYFRLLYYSIRKGISIILVLLNKNGDFTLDVTWENFVLIFELYIQFKSRESKINDNKRSHNEKA